MRWLKTGTTLIELIIYAGLLSLLAALCFGLVLQIRNQQHKVLLEHTTLNSAQIALELLVRDVRASKNLEVKSNHKFNLICRTDTGMIRWQLDNDLVLSRTDYQTKFKKPAISRVAENIKNVVVSYKKKTEKRFSHSNSSKLVQVTINQDSRSGKLARLVTLRKTMQL